MLFLEHLTGKVEMLFISIPEPCHEKWYEMTPTEHGAFCSLCSKTVVDFTNLSDEEVKNYFLSRLDQKTCGRFRNDQLVDHKNTLTKLLDSSLPFWKKFLAIVVIIFGSLLTGCDQRNIGKMKAADSFSKTENINMTGITIGETGSDTDPTDTSNLDCTITEVFTDGLIGETISMPIQEFIEGKISIENLDDPPADTTSALVYDENGNPIE